MRPWTGTFLSALSMALLCSPGGWAADRARDVRVVGPPQTVKVTQGKKTFAYHHLAPGGSLSVTATGPGLMQISVRQALEPGTVADLFTLHSLRDGTMEHSAELGGPQDRRCKVGAPFVGVSKVKKLQFEVPAGEHEYAFRVDHAPDGILLRATATSKRVAKQIARETRRPEPAASPETAAPAPTVPAAPDASASAPPSPTGPPEPAVEEEVLQARADEGAAGTATTAPAGETPGIDAAGPASRRSFPWIGVGLVVDLLVSAGKPSDTSLSAGQAAPSGSTGVAVPLLLDLRGYIPVWDPYLALVPAIEIGWYRLQGDGEVELPNDPDFPSYEYSWHIDNLPIFAGLSATLRPLPDIPLYLSVGAGFAANYSWAQTTYERENHFPVTNAVQEDWGIGYYVGVEAAYGLGPGRLNLEYRYSSARTDLKFKDVYDNAYNSELGDLQGSHIMLGYCLDLPWWTESRPASAERSEP